jgi:hypothetical protein
MLEQYIDYGCEFRHALEIAQKRAWPLEHEPENFVYGGLGAPQENKLRRAI